MSLGSKVTVVDILTGHSISPCYPVTYVTALTPIHAVLTGSTTEDITLNNFFFQL